MHVKSQHLQCAEQQGSSQTSPDAAPATQSDTATSPNVAPATKSGTATSPSGAAATKSLTKYCACNET